MKRRNFLRGLLFSAILPVAVRLGIPEFVVKEDEIRVNTIKWLHNPKSIIRTMFVLNEGKNQYTRIEDLPIISIKVK